MEYVVAVVVGLALAEVATLITTIYLHRVLSHRSIRLHPALTMFMRFGTWMLTSISPREWVAVHRKHHNFSDVEGDPHSPHIEGYWQIMIGNVYYYRREANNDNTMEKYAADLPFDRLDTTLLRRGVLGFSLTGVLLVVLFGVFGPGWGVLPGLTALATLAVVYLLLNAAINGAGHTFGYKSFENDATNLKYASSNNFRGGSAQQPPRPSRLGQARGLRRGDRSRMARDPSAGEAPARGGPHQSRRRLGRPSPPHSPHHGQPDGCEHRQSRCGRTNEQQIEWF